MLRNIRNERSAVARVWIRIVPTQNAGGGARTSHVAYLRTPSTEMIRSTVCDAGPRSILMSKSFRVSVVLPSKPAR